MKYASVLAGERFSDSPRCTDPTLAALVLATLVRVRQATGRSLDRHVLAARRRLARVSGDGRLARGLEPAHRRGSGHRLLIAAVDATAQLPAPDRDELLLSVLAAAVGSPVTRSARTTGTDFGRSSPLTTWT